MSAGRDPDLKQALRPVPMYERAVREVSRMFSEAGIRHALVGALGANAYRAGPAQPKISPSWSATRLVRSTRVAL